MPPMWGQNNSCQSKIRIVVSWTAPREISKQDCTESGESGFLDDFSRPVCRSHDADPETYLKSAKISYLDSRSFKPAPGLCVHAAVVCKDVGGKLYHRLGSAAR
jgi:hypothetical protein